MRFYQLFFLACISKTIADLPAPDLPTSDFSVSFPTDSDSPDWGTLHPADSGFVDTGEMGNSASSYSNLESLNNFGLDNQDELNIGFVPKLIPSMETEVSKSGCPSGTASNALRQMQQCTTTLSDNDQAIEEETKRQNAKKEDDTDTDWVKGFFKTWAKEHPGKKADLDGDAKKMCAQVPGLQQLPLCCRGPMMIYGIPPTQRSAQDKCVAYIEGRPRCLLRAVRFCCWYLGLDEDYPDLGYDCRRMFPDFT